MSAIARGGDSGLGDKRPIISPFELSLAGRSRAAGGGAGGTRG